MSYILDALKKSEAENDPAAAASLALAQQRESARNRTVAFLIVIALLVNAAVLLWIFRPEPGTWSEPAGRSVAVDRPEPATPEVSTPTAASAVPPSPEPLVSAPRTEAPANVPAVDSMPPAPARVTPRQAPAKIRTRLAELPEGPKGRFPGLAFSTHVYAEDAYLRAVVANGTRLQEGDRLDSVTVEEITEEGVIVAFENYLVEIPVIESWQ